MRRATKEETEVIQRKDTQQAYRFPIKPHPTINRTHTAETVRPKGTSLQVSRVPTGPPAYRPRPMPTVLQAKRAGGQLEPDVNRATRRPVAPPVYRPQPVPRVLQLKVTVTAVRSAQPRRAPVAPPVYRPQLVAKSLQPFAATKPQLVSQSRRVHLVPNVYRPQPLQRVLQTKSNKHEGESKASNRWHSPVPVLVSKALPVQCKPNMEGTNRPGCQMIPQPESATARPSALSSRPLARFAPPRVVNYRLASAIQRAAEAPAKITAKGLKANDYAFVEVAHKFVNPASVAPANTVVTMKVLTLGKGNLDYKTTARPIEDAMAATVRNETSASAIHNNEEGRLPLYDVPVTGAQPYLEYLAPGLGGSRFIVDVAANKVYLSYHYGDSSAKEDDIPKFAAGNKAGKNKISAFVELDGTWTNRRFLTDDAALWWATLGLGVAGT